MEISHNTPSQYHHVAGYFLSPSGYLQIEERVLLSPLGVPKINQNNKKGGELLVIPIFDEAARKLLTIEQMCSIINGYQEAQQKLKGTIALLFVSASCYADKEFGPNLAVWFQIPGGDHFCVIDFRSDGNGRSDSSPTAAQIATALCSKEKESLKRVREVYINKERRMMEKKLGHPLLIEKEVLLWQ